MRAGDEVQVRIIEKISETKALVDIIDSGEKAVLKKKGRLRISKDGTVTAWVIQHNSKNNDIILGNAYFGKYDISPNITALYLRILNSVFNEPESVSSEDISVLKGMVNRCIKHDQWDWYTTYKYLSYPSYQLMNLFVKECVQVRKALLNDERNELFAFREKYAFLLRSIALHLDEEMQVPVLENGETIQELEQELWERMSFDSRNNIRIVERIAGSASKYTLMHYLVTVEQEFFAHYIQPFISVKGRHITTGYRNPYIKTTHEILTGRTHFSMGSIYYLGKNLNDARALRDSEAMQEFYSFLGEKRIIFQEICSIISSHQICGLRITELRNGLAHGNAEIIAKINSNAYQEMHNLLFGAPIFLMKKILKNSFNFS